jgi:uroporphyrinogen-III synthase
VARARYSTKSTVVSNENSLRGVRVLVTRPALQAEPLAQLIEAAGGEAVRLPTIEIAAPANSAALQAVFDHLSEFSFAIFISPNAVRMAMPLLRARDVPSSVRLAAVGQGTLRALHETGAEQVLAPVERFDSEALLELLPPATVAGKKILIVRGEGGREQLGASLTARGAHVAYAECYRRVSPHQPDRAALARLRHGDIDIIVLTSSEGARNLCALVGSTGQVRLFATPLVVVSERLAQACRELGFRADLSVAAQASDAAILAALSAWRARQKSL